MSKLEDVARAMMHDAWEDVTDIVCLCSGEELHYKRYNSLLRASDRLLSLRYACAALEAIREPSDAMLRAGQAAGDEYASPLPGEAWKAMIGTILDEPQT